MARFKGPISLMIDGSPAGVTAPKEVVIPANQSQIDIPLKADATAKVQGGRLHIRGTGMLPFAPFTAGPLPVTRTATWAATRRWTPSGLPSPCRRRSRSPATTR